MKACSLFILFICGTAISSSAQTGYYPPPSVSFHQDTLTIYPPDSLPGDPVILLGYNIYVDNAFFDNIQVSNPIDTINYIFDAAFVLPGNHVFCVDGVYNEWISDPACDTGLVIYGHELPFLEDWSSGSFEEQGWTIDSENWVISMDDGNPAPSGEFKGNPAQTNYSLTIESHPLKAIGMNIGNIWLDFDIFLENNQATGNEYLKVQVWNWTQQTWFTVAVYQNNNSYNWIWKHINISGWVMDKIFKVRFLATGINSADIGKWVIDNINIYRSCDGPFELTLEEYSDYNYLEWLTPNWGFSWWLQWDDGINSGNSIGTGGAVEFDVAARWLPAQLAPYDGMMLTKIAFFPAESTTNYRARVWIGDEGDSLVVDEPVISPVINQWNYYTLVNPIVLDASKALWVGYNVATPYGYPAGVDDGPAIDGYGNWMFWDSTWQTLLEINPGLDYNWNIICYVFRSSYDDAYCNIYRDTNSEGFQFYDHANVWTYIDSNIVPEDHYCYQVTTVYVRNGDSCESPANLTVCEELNIGVEENEQKKSVSIYPNPAHNLLNIESGEIINEIRLYDLLGVQILSAHPKQSGYQLNLQHLPSGIYFITVKIKSEIIKEKIIIQK
jgi:hypothetical protein